MNKYAYTFLRTFGLSLSEYWTWHGFDSLKFDTWIEAGDESLLDVVEKKYGANATAFVQRMLTRK